MTVAMILCRRFIHQVIREGIAGKVIDTGYCPTFILCIGQKPIYVIEYMQFFREELIG